MRIRKMKKDNKGSALILVIIVTVLLCVVGIMFVMTTRIREITTSNAADSRDLDTAVQTLVSRIQTVLLQDLFGTDLNRNILNNGNGADINEAYDSTGADAWLASLEPDAMTWQWPSITNLSDGAVSPSLTWNRLTSIIPDYQTADGIQEGYPADTDGDGVADSMWIQLADYTQTPAVPLMNTSRGKRVFAAVRIIDNCAMLNLNGANCFQSNTYSIGTKTYTGWFYYNYPPDNNYHLHNDSTIIAQYYKEGGRYLSETNYLPFLRGYGSNFDKPYGILAAKKFAQVNTSGDLTLQWPVSDLHDVVVNLENPKNIPATGMIYNFFDIGDELEMRNRFLLTSYTVSRFENEGCAYNTFDFLRGTFTGGWHVEHRVKRIPIDNLTDLGTWRQRLNPLNFDAGGTGPYPGYYEHRHVCTFYSFDRNVRSGPYNFLDSPTALPSVSAAQRLTVEKVFRPNDHQPIDLRKMTEPNMLDVTTGNLVANPDYIIADTVEARRHILHLLYAFREFFYDDILLKGTVPISEAEAMAARQAAQYVANMIDYLDDDTTATTGPFSGGAYGSQINSEPTFIIQLMIDQMIAEVSGSHPEIMPSGTILAAFDFGLPAGEVIYGYERQPFISEVYSNNPGGGGITAFAVELVNPYDTAIDLDGWNIKVGLLNNIISSSGSYVVPAGSPSSPGRLTVYAGAVTVSGSSRTFPNLSLPVPIPSPLIGLDNLVRLQRPAPDAPGDPNRLFTVDQITEDQRSYLIQDETRDIQRKESGWAFTNNRAAEENDTTHTLGAVNSVSSVSQKGYQLPVANTVIEMDRLADFQKVICVGNDPNAITESIAIAAGAEGESEVRFDPLTSPFLLRYICTLSREEKGIPGRININTAPVHVIAAAIPPQLVMTGEAPGDPNYVDSLTLAQDIVDNRPYEHLSELLDISVMKKYAVRAGFDLGEQGINDDLEEWDWIFNRLSNIFTVRSDTFTAYILVRLGTDGPQRRMIAIFDRSNCWTATDKPRLVALHPVPDPR